MLVHEFIRLWRIEYYAENLHVCLIIITTTSQIYKSWSLLDSNSKKTRTRACITQNQKDFRSRKLNHKYSHNPYVRPATFEFSDLSLFVLKHDQCCSCGLSSFRPTEVILTPSRKIRNIQLRFVFLNFSFVCQNSLRWSEAR